MSGNPSKQTGRVYTRREFYCDPEGPGYKLVERVALEMLDRELAFRRLALEILDEALAKTKDKA